MKTWVRKTLAVGVLAAGALLFGPAAAHADGGHHGKSHNGGPIQATGANNGILNGTQLAVPVSVPLNVVGNSIGVAGEANSVGAGVNRIESGHGGQVTGMNNGILNGTQAYLPVSVPVNVVGNSLAVLGEANSAGVGANRIESAHTTEGHWGPGGQWTGSNNGIGNGTQIYAPVSIPVNVCGNSLALLGEANAGAICANDVFGDGFGGNWGGNNGHHGHGHGHHGESAKTESTKGHPAQVTGMNNGILNGTQLYAPISLPVNLAGNSVALLGEANSRAIAGNKVESANGGWGGQVTGSNNGILNGTQIAAPISVPINVCGNALGILGGANAAASCSNDVFGGDDFDGGWVGDDHGHKGHGHGHKGHGNGNGNAGDNGNKDDDYKGDHGNKGDGNGNKDDNKGYGDQGDEPATNDGNKDDDKGYGAVSPDQGSDTDSKGGRDNESTPVSGLTSTVGNAADGSGIGGLGLLNTLR